MNDVSLRNLIPREVGTGFGFVQSKPPSSFAPFAVTTDEAYSSWRDGRLHLPVISTLNGETFGTPSAGEMHFSFFDLVRHACMRRPLSAGSIIGGGTVSNKDEHVGSSCIAEKRTIEQLQTGAATTRYLQPSDIVQIEVYLPDTQQSLFGQIHQEVIRIPQNHRHRVE